MFFHVVLIVHEWRSTERCTDNWITLTPIDNIQEVFVVAEWRSDLDGSAWKDELIAILAHRHRLRNWCGCQPRRSKWASRVRHCEGSVGSDCGEQMGGIV
ncbi:hypothetical protein BLNAU_16059 [Blattamonas nauphoetae]|uniref:Uncharacterized protein n=1 Tax=Blattamonas nauphoetae TaxID=2049346 RepID=A0ABQ9X4Y3_9EUKA|nr:hypothetical protein BLNAU_18829 [Blattamonas nauphoetae]KAK2946820.1 hypothetical protein BLNAU_18278 [Blattamonas nauphoetae]KAK2949059.1 hypothetical protein BLNAU_16059 [Blattamonas nauphoetae]